MNRPKNIRTCRQHKSLYEFSDHVKQLFIYLHKNSYFCLEIEQLSKEHGGVAGAFKITSSSIKAVFALEQIVSKFEKMNLI